MSDYNAQAVGSMQPPQHDGSIDGAVATMPDFDDNLVPFEQARDGVQPQRRQQQPRELNGRWTAEEQAELDAARGRNSAPPGPKTSAAESAAAEDAEADADVSTPAEEYFELPPEKEGGEPVRIKADEVFTGYQRARELETELAELKQSAPPPVEYDHEIYKTVQVRGRMLKELETYAHLLQPQQPQMELLNQASHHFNPDLYYQQVQMAQQMTQQLQAVRQRMDELQDDQSAEQEALASAKFAREKSKLSQIWPEVLSNPQKAHAVREAAARFYGIDNQTFATTHDARFYAILKDALAYRDGIKAQQTAAKVVRAKPRLVRASARSGETAKQMAVTTAMQRVSRSGSLDDAADAIGGLLS
jgi:hypothetical protein